MAKESVLSLEDTESITIEDFIFHIIIQENEEPTYLESVLITEDQKNFFRQRLIDVSYGNQFVFVDKTTSPTYILCEDIISDPEANFIKISKTLTASFKSHHNRNTSDGVFITARAKIRGNIDLIFLIKLDHKKVLRYKVKNHTALLEEIKNTFVEDKSAVQKVALLDIGDNYKWDVLVIDKAKPGGITDYFRNFLTVKLRDTPSKWTEDAIKHSQRWANNNRSLIDPEQQPFHYKERALAYLASTELFNTDQYIDYVIHDEDEERRKILKQSFLDYITEQGLYGQEFPPNKGSLTTKTKKTIVRTSEGVTLEWVGNATDANIDIPNQKGSDGLYTITIKTTDIKNLQ